MNKIAPPLSHLKVSQICWLEMNLANLLFILFNPLGALPKLFLILALKYSCSVTNEFFELGEYRSAV